LPTNDPTGIPTYGPTGEPTWVPTGDPTANPSADPTADPSSDHEDAKIDPRLSMHNASYWSHLNLFYIAAILTGSVGMLYASYRLNRSKTQVVPEAEDRVAMNLPDNTNIPLEQTYEYEEDEHSSSNNSDSESFWSSSNPPSEFDIENQSSSSLSSSLPLSLGMFYTDDPDEESYDEEEGNSMYKY
jgi:hypothetical protein